MKKNIDPRLPEDIGKEGLPIHASISTPWGKLLNVKEMYDYNNRLQAVYTALFLRPNVSSCRTATSAARLCARPTS